MIKKIKWNNYITLGDLELDLKKEDGSAYNTIILAGENGTGKTTILDSLAAFLDGGSIQPFEYIEYEINGTDFSIFPDDKFAELGFHNRSIFGEQDNVSIRSGKNNNYKLIEKDISDVRHYGFSYSKARSGFNTYKINSITNQHVDVEKNQPDNDEEHTWIKQLIVDIEQQDDAAWRKETIAGKASNVYYEEFEKNLSKAYRFKKAFNEFFDSIKYIGVNNDNNTEKIIEFQKHNNRISIDELSTGEKQIVFRGALLLKNVKSIQGGIVLIDEPELSMHPMWQKKILQYYRNLFTNNGYQNVQMIIATHSEYVLASALEDKENVLVIALSDDDGVIEAKRFVIPSVLPVITSAEINYMIFNVMSVDYHIALYGYLQSKNNINGIKACDEFIKNSNIYDYEMHYKYDKYRKDEYNTLPTYIRNAIDHPESGRAYTDEELKLSIELLIALCKQ